MRDARALAWDILRRVEETDAFADAVLGHRLAESTLERRDQAFATQIVYGTLAWRGFLDRGIETFAGRPAESLDPPIRLLLELSLFQLFKLQRIPAYAAVNSAVNLAKSHKGGRAAGLVNAVLRRAAKDGEAAVILPPRGTDLAAHLAVRYSHPRWLVERWLTQLGAAEAERLLEANNTAAPTVLRANRRRGDRDELYRALQGRGVAVEASASAPDALRFSGGSAFELDEFAGGRCSIQSEASQLVTLLLDPRPGERILDACAGSGGKATYAAEVQDDRGRVVAVDLHRHALSRLRREAERLGLASIETLQADARRLPVGPACEFDRILLDAPCSGLGTLRQHPEIRWRRRAADVEVNARLQREMLAALFDRVRLGGVLVYAVCTPMREENEDVVESLRAGRSDVEVEDARSILPAAAHDFVGADGALRTRPQDGGLDGFFAVRLKRR